MKELKDIIRAYTEASREGKKTALATVVHVQGSAYRRPGARMLVTEDGRLTGAISGGCLEGDALRKAQLSMVQNKPVLVTYDTTDEDDGLGIGLGCNGIISILIEPITDKDINNPIELLNIFFLQHNTAVLVTVFGLDKKTTQPGTCLLINETGKVKGTLVDQSLEKMLIDDARESLSSHTSIIKKYETENQVHAFFQLLEPVISIFIFGAGNDSIPLCQMADILGWETVIIDGRPNYATKERFPLAKKIIVSKPGEILSVINPDSRTIALLMTHNYHYDIAILKQLIPFNLAYIGVLGPKKKLNKMLGELEQNGILKMEDNVSNIYGPAGLDIGAESSEEIALSIISEIKAVLSNRDASFLKEKTTPIHSAAIAVEIGLIE